MNALALYSSIAFITTLSGSAVPLFRESWAHRNIWRLLAYSSGILLGIAFLHLLPEAFELSGKLAGATLLITFVLLFALEEVTMVHACEDFLEPPKSAVVPVTALIALALHAGVDGMAIGVGLRQSIALGGVISLGVILHKFSDGLTLSSLMRAANFRKRKEIILAILLALATPLGAWLSFHWSGPLPAKAIGAV
jgi:zinc and cadmium transporter